MKCPVVRAAAGDRHGAEEGGRAAKSSELSNTLLLPSRLGFGVREIAQGCQGRCHLPALGLMAVPFVRTHPFAEGIRRLTKPSLDRDRRGATQTSAANDNGVKTPAHRACLLLPPGIGGVHGYSGWVCLRWHNAGGSPGCSWNRSGRVTVSRIAEGRCCCSLKHGRPLGVLLG